MQVAADVEAPAVTGVCPRNHSGAGGSFRATTVREWFFLQEQLSYPIDASAVQSVESSS
jgi:hypothetical protein